MPVENSPHRNKRGLRTGLLIALVLGGGFVIVEFWPREPRYQGKTLREWLAPPSTTLQVSFGMGQYGFEADTNNAYVRAIQYFGPGAVPVLRCELRAKDSPLKLTMVGLLAKAHLWRPKIIEARVRRQFAVQACQILGPAGKDLVPDLARLLECHTNRNEIAPICRALASMGPAGFPALLAGLTNQHSALQLESVDALGHVWYDKSAAVPRLLELSQSSDQRLANRAVVALNRGASPQSSANALAQLLRSTNTTTLLLAVGMLEHLNTNALTALPALLNLASNAPTEEIKDAAMKAIAKVSPAPEAK